PLKWMAIESLQNYEFSPMTDVYVLYFTIYYLFIIIILFHNLLLRYYVIIFYSFRWSYGVLLFELTSYGGEPYPNVNPLMVQKYLEDGNRMRSPEHCDSDV